MQNACEYPATFYLVAINLYPEEGCAERLKSADPEKDELQLEL